MLQYLNNTVQFNNVYRKLPFEITTRLGCYGKIVGTKLISYRTKSFIVEFSDNTRLWLFEKEIKFLN
uniref:Cytochrome b6-f complex subunit PetP n=1 Tax=Bangiopsis subsimplex TaxID=139980 RepID=A0A1Y9TLF0_9RHOD|nr:hypothetical protein [Bangiopsis subsimplex]